jgi:hypothetical protein
MDMPSLGWWHVPQERPLVPRLWKNGPVRSMPPLAVLWVWDAPPGFGKNTPLGMKENCCPPAAATTISAATANKTALIITAWYWRKNGDFLVENGDR